MIIISIDTSTKVCSLALHKAGLLLACQEFHVEKATSQVLTIGIEQLLTTTNHTFADVCAIAVDKGPGSYTGLRIGVATAKGLCYALDKPLLAVSTLETMVAGMVAFDTEIDHYYCPMIDARRMEVFCGVYDRNGQNILPVKAEIINANSFNEVLVKNKVVFFGDGASKCRSCFEHQSNAVFVEECYPSARFMGKLAWTLYQNNQWEDLETFEPFYLKEFVSKASMSN